MRRLLPFLLLPALAVASVTACGASPTKPHTQASASAAPSAPDDGTDGATDGTDDNGGDDTGPDCAPVDGNSPAGLLAGTTVFPGGTDLKATYEHHTFAAAQCQTDPDRPTDLDAGCAQPFPFVSAGQQPFTHALLGTTGAQEMNTATLSGGGHALREIVVSYADAKTVAGSFPMAFAKACGKAAGSAYQVTGQDADGGPITSVVEAAGAKIVVVEFDGAGWADADHARVLNLALTAAG